MRRTKIGSTGESVSFHEFVAARSAALIRTAFLLTGDWQRAEDLLQTALMNCYGRWAQLRDPEAYVVRTMVTTAVGWRRRRWSGEVPTEVLPEHSSGVDPSPGWADRVDLVRLLGELAPRQRAVVVLRFYLDLSETEVAAVLGISVGTVKSQAARALAHLRSAAQVGAARSEASE